MTSDVQNTTDAETEEGNIGIYIYIYIDDVVRLEGYFVMGVS